MRGMPAQDLEVSCYELFNQDAASKSNLLGGCVLFHVPIEHCGRCAVTDCPDSSRCDALRLQVQAKFVWLIVPLPLV